MQVKDVLKIKGKNVECIDPTFTISEALKHITEKKVGALLVKKGEELIGIITERDILRLMATQGEAAFSHPVKEIMTQNVIVGLPEDDIEQAAAYITNNRFRHLPIMDNKKLVGIVSIGDIVKALAHDLKVENRYLKDYITGKYPG
jgi:CBS domain-containing protein